MHKHKKRAVHCFASITIHILFYINIEYFVYSWPFLFLKYHNGSVMQSLGIDSHRAGNLALLHMHEP